VTHESRTILELSNRPLKYKWITKSEIATVGVNSILEAASPLPPPPSECRPRVTQPGASSFERALFHGWLTGRDIMSHGVGKEKQSLPSGSVDKGRDFAHMAGIFYARRNTLHLMILMAAEMSLSGERL
jgi:hypothetical protein